MADMIKKTDLAPEISIDVESRIVKNIETLQKILGVTDMTPMAAGSVIKQYKTDIKGAVAVGEGEEIGLTKVERKLVNTIDLPLYKFRKLTTAEAIQSVGRDIAINKTDEAIVGLLRSDLKKSFFATLPSGAEVETAPTLQAALAYAWGDVKDYYEDTDATPLFIVPTYSIAEYLATAQVTVQTAFGFDYIENFLGMGDAIITNNVNCVLATAKENINGAYIPMSGGDVASEFGLTSDSTGLVGMKHYTDDAHGAIGSLFMTGVTFYPEMADGVFAYKVTGA